MKKRVIIIGAGPAGLSAAYRLLDFGITPFIIETDEVVGGIAKTFFENGNGTDIGPHRFFTKNKQVKDLWEKLLPLQGAPSCDDKLLNREVSLKENGPDPEKDENVFLSRKRFSRIYYSKHFLDYPLKIKPANILAMGLATTFIAGCSYLKSCFYKLPETNLESFMINRFGRVLYELFFEGYTQKVWGVHPSNISKEWGMQRIKGISLMKVVLDAFCKLLSIKHKKETSLVDEYIYPKYGSSQLWNVMADKIKAAGGEIILNSKVIKIVKNENKISSVKFQNTKTGEISELSADLFISSMPIKSLLTRMNNVPDNIVELAKNLSYRDFILVNFVTKKINLKNNTTHPTINNIAPDSWIYLQDNGIKAGRLDIMNNFSPYIIKDFTKDVIINMEYFCNESDDFWKDEDINIINFAISELKKLNVLDDNDIKSSKVIRVKKAYPSYFGSYDKFDEIKSYINSVDNLYCVGRNGQHKYNNMDHSILSGLIAAEIIAENKDKNILWDVNTDSEYQETK